MNKKEIFEKIIEITLKKEVEVQLVVENRSQVKSKIDVNFITGKIRKCEPVTFFISENNLSWLRIYPSLPKEKRMIWGNYSGKLFTMLHEIGHCHCNLGLPYQKVKIEKNKLLNNPLLTQEEFDVQYRLLLSERLADDWATQWVKNHPNMAKYFSDLLIKEYGS